MGRRQICVETNRPSLSTPGPTGINDAGDPACPRYPAFVRGVLGIGAPGDYWIVAGKPPLLTLAVGEAPTDLEAEIDDAFARLERGEIPQQGALLQDLLHHNQQAEALGQLRAGSSTPMPGRPGKTPDGAAVNPNPGYQSAHSTPQSVLRGLPGYDPGAMITRILPTGRGHPHTLFDQYWQREFRDITEQTGRTTTTTEEVFEVLSRAALNSGAFSSAEAHSMIGLFHEDLYVRMGLSPTQQLRMPGH